MMQLSIASAIIVLLLLVSPIVAAKEEEEHRHLNYRNSGRRFFLRSQIKVGARCSNDHGCAPDQYCHAGYCARQGTCDTVMDCWNPSNGHRVHRHRETKCRRRRSNRGRGRRHVDGRCVRSRSSSSGHGCPRDLPPVADCNVCDEDDKNCVNYPCGECRALRFDPQGHLMCSSNDDCDGDGTYCQSGRCAAMGTCQQKSDCWNPSNNVEGDTCSDATDVVFSCRNERCEKQCKPKDFSSECPAKPCKRDCDESVTCVDDMSSCTPFHFDAMGTQVCKDQDKSCTTSSECIDDAYCSVTSGFCQRDGTCEEDADCLDPQNSFPVSGCFGLLSCNGNTKRCEERCFDNDQPCPTTTSFVPCRPCEVGKCQGSVQCRENFCGGCNYIFFDTSGKEMCKDDDGN